MATKKKRVSKAVRPKAPRRTKTAPKKTSVRPRTAPSKVPTVSKFMTPSVFTIGAEEPLSNAHALMNEHRIRHLPVLDGGELVGVVSQRDLYFLESIDNAERFEMRVDEAMTRDVFATLPDAPLATVVREMIRGKLGSAIVTRGGKVVGVFTAIDGLEALLGYLPG